MKSKLFLGLLAIILLAGSSNGFCNDISAIKKVEAYRDGTFIMLTSQGDVYLSDRQRENKVKLAHSIWDKDETKAIRSITDIEVEGLDILVLLDNGLFYRFKGHLDTHLSFVAGPFWPLSHNYVEKFSNNFCNVVGVDELIAINVSKLQRNTDGELEIVTKDGTVKSYEKDFK